MERDQENRPEGSGPTIVLSGALAAVTLAFIHHASDGHTHHRHEVTARDGTVLDARPDLSEWCPTCRRAYDAEAGAWCEDPGRHAR